MMIDTVRRHFWFLLLAPILGVLLGSYLSTLNIHDRVSFWWTPVVTMTGELIAPPTDSYVVIRMRGTKHRGAECEYKGIQAVGDRLVGEAVDLHISRVDMPELGNTKPQGDYDIGTWRVWPVDGVRTVVVYVTHHCMNDDGRVSRVATQIAKVNL